LYRLTFAHDRNSRQSPPTHNWRKFKTAEEAAAAAESARAAARPEAVANGVLRNRNRGRKPAPVPPPKTGTDTQNFPPPKTGTTGSVQEPALHSISRVGERSGAGEASLQPDRDPHERNLIPLVWRTPVVTEVMDQFAAAAIRTALTHTVSPHLRQAMVRRGWAMQQNTKETA
jgi:hypothetical protein